MYFLYSLFLVMSLTSSKSYAFANLIVQVEEGQLRGVEMKTLLTEKTICAFLGVPYAKPPIGELRFEAPIPIEEWDGVLNAREEANVCIQVAGSRSEMIGSEDCLYLNIYTPQAPSSIEEKKAVMVFIHGGGFSEGSSALFGPDYLVEYDVILVTLNYRLHVFGFLNTGTANCSGNAGLKDQLLAMKWIKKNIASFGGDSENITLFGASAGAVSVHLHMLSPLSKGFFHKAIMQSGNALSCWAIETDPVSQARKMGHSTGYQGQDLEGLVQHLRNQTAERLTALADQFYQDNKQNFPGRCVSVLFTPSVETIKEGAFLPDFPKRLMQSASPLPAIIGYNNMEGLALYGALKPGSMKSLLNDISIAIRDNFAKLDENGQAELLAEIEEFYFKNRTTTLERITGIVNLFTGLYFMKFFEAIDHLVRSDNPLYIYLFEYEKSTDIYNTSTAKPCGSAMMKGAAHGDELKYMFKKSGTTDYQPMNEKDEEMIERICTLWTNFAKTGYPKFSLLQIDWKPFSSRQPYYLRIGQTVEVVDGKPQEACFKFWKKWSKFFSLRSYHRWQSML